MYGPSKWTHDRVKNMISSPNNCQWFILDDIQIREPLIEMCPRTITTSTQVITLSHKAATEMYILLFLNTKSSIIKVYT